LVDDALDKRTARTSCIAISSRATSRSLSVFIGREPQPGQ